MYRAGDRNQFTITVQDLGCQFNLRGIHALTRATPVRFSTARFLEV